MSLLSVVFHSGFLLRTAYKRSVNTHLRKETHGFPYDQPFF